MSHPGEELSAYLDGALGDGERASVESHLGDCPDCRARLDELRTVVRTLAAAPKRELPAGYLERLKTRHAARTSAEEDEPAPRGRSRFRVAVEVALTAAVAATILVSLVQSRPFVELMSALLQTVQSAAGALGGEDK